MSRRAAVDGGRRLPRLRRPLEPHLDVFDEVGVRFADEVHPSESRIDYWTAVAALVVGRAPQAFGLNWDRPASWRDLDRVGFAWDFARPDLRRQPPEDAKRQTDGRKDAWVPTWPGWIPDGAGTSCSTGHGDVPWEACFRMLNTVGYDGPISIEWEDAGMDRLVGAPEALQFVRRLAFDPPAAAFDAAFSSGG